MVFTGLDKRVPSLLGGTCLSRLLFGRIIHSLFEWVWGKWQPREEEKGTFKETVREKWLVDHDWHGDLTHGPLCGLRERMDGPERDWRSSVELAPVHQVKQFGNRYGRMFMRFSWRRVRAACFIAIVVVTAIPGFAAELWVAPHGDDAAAGTRNSPLATLEGARRAVARHPARGREPIVVRILPGTYYLEKTLVFTPADSGSADAPVRYEAAEEGQVIISGGRRLVLDFQPYQGQIVQARIPPGLTFDQLFINGERQHLARYPNYDPSAKYFQGFAADCIAPERVARWADPRGAFFHAMHRALWGDMHWRITGKTSDGRLEMEGGWQNNRPSPPHPQYRFVENVFEELDAPGEWYLDADRGILYLYPPDGVNLKEAKIEAAGLPHLIEFQGTVETPVHHIELKGLVFTHTARTFTETREPLLRSDWTIYRGGAVFLTGAEDCAVEDCRFDQVGGNALFISGYNRRIRVTGCHIVAAGASGVCLVGLPKSVRSPLFRYDQTLSLEEMDRTPGPKTPDYPADCLVEDCLIERIGRFEKQTAGVNISMAESITVRHCSIYDCPRAGINICDGTFGGHLIEFCDVFDTVKETGDHGSFNSWGRDRFWHPDGTVTVEWVRKYPDMPKWDCWKTIVLRYNRWRCDHGWDIDLDDGSSNYEIYGNLCLAGGIKNREGYDRLVHNNIIVGNTFHPHVWYPQCRTSFVHNIVWQDRYLPARMTRTDQGDLLDYNLVHSPGMEEPRPARGLQAFGGDVHSLVADARFVDPSRGDFRVREDSPALALGFKNFPMDQFGVQKPSLKRIARTPPLPEVVSRPVERPQPAKDEASERQWMGAQVRQIQGLGDQSAYGLPSSHGVAIVAVTPGSPADRAGLRPDDVIVSCNGKPVQTVADLMRLGRTAEGQPLHLRVIRNQKEMTVTMRQ